MQPYVTLSLNILVLRITQNRNVSVEEFGSLFSMHKVPVENVPWNNKC